MATLKTCPICGVEIPADAPEGLCPRCLAGLAAGELSEAAAPDDEAFAADLPD